MENREKSLKEGKKEYEKREERNKGKQGGGEKVLGQRQRPRIKADQSPWGGDSDT